MVVHSDEVEPRIIGGTQLRGTRWRLGAAAGAVRAGLSRYRIGPGERAMPVHVHADEEELFYVLDGEGLSWQDGRAYAVRAGDCVLHLAGAAPGCALGSVSGPRQALEEHFGEEVAGGLEGGGGQVPDPR